MRPDRRAGSATETGPIPGETISKGESMPVRNRYLKRLTLPLALSATFGLMAGCASESSLMVQEKLPTIAHVHVGHANTGWKQTPDQKGLFTTAEAEGQAALTHAKAAVAVGADTARIKAEIAAVAYAITGEGRATGDGLGFGLKKALAEAGDHILFAAESDDASENVRLFAGRFQTDSAVVIERCDLVVALAQEVALSGSADDAAALAEEIAFQTALIIDAQSDDPAAGGEGDVGLVQLRQEMDAMIAREDPPYRPVARKYLFGLIRLPDGKWTFSWLTDQEPSEGGNY
jgi:hypothetical protein